MQPPANPKIYHILHWDRLPSIIADGCLWSDAEVRARKSPGTTIGMNSIKDSRLRKPLNCYPDLHVGQCVPFNFCPRSFMLYILHKGNHPGLNYFEGQQPIIHLQADLHQVVRWAKENGVRWAFTDRNANIGYCEFYTDLSDLGALNWSAIQATRWQYCQEEKQAEFLIERSLPWELVEFIGVHNQQIAQQVNQTLRLAAHKPPVHVRRDWYY